MILKIRSMQPGENWCYVDGIARLTISNLNKETYDRFKRRVFKINDVVTVAGDYFWEECGGLRGMKDKDTPRSPLAPIPRSQIRKWVEAARKQMEKQPYETSADVKEEAIGSLDPSSPYYDPTQDPNTEFYGMDIEEVESILESASDDCYDPTKDPMAPQYVGGEDTSHDSMSHIKVKPGQSIMEKRLNMARDTMTGKEFERVVEFFEAKCVNMTGEEFSIYFDGYAFLLNDHGKTVDRFEAGPHDV